ncbi:MAG: 2'-5' RNA ligase family protein [Roseburia sp.]
MYLISVYFDEKANSILNRYIKVIAGKTGNTFMTDHHVPPHMTISSIEARSEEVLREPFMSLQGKLEKGNIQFVSMGQLLPYVFYAMPVLNEYLMELSNQIYQSVQDIPETTISRFYRPGSWLPHVTLGKTLTKKQMQEAFCMMQEHFQPFEATVTEIGLAKVNPHEDVIRLKL